jgi:hypothetical protein
VTVRMSPLELRFSRRHRKSLGIYNVSWIEIWPAVISWKSLPKRHRRRNWKGPFAFCHGIVGFNFVLNEWIFWFFWIAPVAVHRISRMWTVIYMRLVLKIWLVHFFSIRKAVDSHNNVLEWIFTGSNPSARFRSHDTEDFDLTIHRNHTHWHMFRPVGVDCRKWHCFLPECLSIQRLAVSEGHKRMQNKKSAI